MRNTEKFPRIVSPVGLQSQNKNAFCRPGDYFFMYETCRIVLYPPPLQNLPEKGGLGGAGANEKRIPDRLHLIFWYG